jgi:hypothetical protein
MALLALPVTGCALVPDRLRTLLDGNQQPVPIAPARTPEEAVRRAVTLFGQRELPPGFEVLETRPIPNVADIVLVRYRFLPPAEGQPSTAPAIGIQLVARQETSWDSQSGSALSRTGSPEQVIEYLHIAHHAGGGTYATVFGHVLTPDVAVVEATFDNGQTLRDQVKHDSFVLVAPHAKAARELRTLDKSGRVLRRFDLPPPVEAGG